MTLTQNHGLKSSSRANTSVKEGIAMISNKIQGTSVQENSTDASEE
jgi:hypothetical protein